MIYEFMATQDLHGYDKPWAPGANLNIVGDYSIINGYIRTSDYAIVSSSNDKSIAIKCSPETTYSFYIKRIETVAVSDNLQIAAYTGEDPPEIGSITQILYNSNYSIIPSTHELGATGSFTTPENTSYLVIKIANKQRTDFEKTLETFQIQTGSAITDYYSPYANICMPEGFNIWDPENAEYVQIYAGYVNSNTRELLLRPVYSEYDGEELVGPWMSSLDPYDEDTTPTEGAFVIDFGGELFSLEITPFMLQTLLESLGIRQHFLDGASLLNSLMDQAQGRVRSEDELLNRSMPLKVIAIGDRLPAGLKFKPISKDVLPGLPGKFIR